MEFIPGKESLLTGCMFFVDGLILIISPLFLLYFTKNTEIFTYLSFFINLFAIGIFAMIYIPESTKYLIEKEKFDEAQNDLMYIFRVNRMTPNES